MHEYCIDLEFSVDELLKPDESTKGSRSWQVSRIRFFAAIKIIDRIVELGDVAVA